MKRSPKHNNVGIAQFRKAIGQQVEFLHPALVGGGTGLEQFLDVHSLIAQTAASRVGRVREVRTERNQSALTGVVDGQTVDSLGRDASLANVDVIKADHCGPVAGLRERFLARTQLRALAKVAELPGDQPLVASLRQRLDVVQDRASLWDWSRGWPARRRKK